MKYLPPSNHSPFTNLMHPAIGQRACVGNLKRQRQSGLKAGRSPRAPRVLTESELSVPGRVLIKRRQLLQKVPLCERTILNLEKRGQFPRRFRITSRLVAWDLKEVDAWIAEQQTAARLPAMPQAQPGQGRPPR
ncbi:MULTISPECIES: helix-turn-helix transcriptional regulator [unclassified Janthinobacterium]|uniref:helix-turn-helix transcriptional regulator n=1 Tax=unclassified Janthinobacterium TaxID=2610881 RepID=UPI002E77AE8B|nr:MULTISPECIES: AlpA family phage regulatory protein [unclassified Janthinobacterium]